MTKACSIPCSPKACTRFTKKRSAPPSLPKCMCRIFLATDLMGLCGTCIPAGGRSEQIEIFRDDRLLAEGRGEPCTAPGDESRGEAVIVAHLCDGGRDAIDVTGVAKQAVLAVVYQPARTRRAGRDHRNAGAPALQYDVAEHFVPRSQA